MGWKEWQGKRKRRKIVKEAGRCFAGPRWQTVTQGYKTEITAQKVKSRVVCDRDGRKNTHTHTHSVWHRLRHLTRQVKSKRGSKIRKVEVATQKGWLKIHLDWKWGARREKHDVGEKHLQASDDNRLWHMWGQVLGAHTSWTLPSTTESFNLLRTQKLEYNVCLLPFVCTRLYTCAFRLHCEYWVG